MTELAQPLDRAATAELLAAIEQVREIVAAGADEAEAAGTLPSSTVAALRAAGLFAMKVPAVLGGAEADLIAQMDAIEALAYVDACAAWCVMVGASAIAWPAAFLPEEGVAELFGDGRIPTAAVAIQPTGTASKVAGGYRVHGRWSFASGIRHAEWIVAGALTDASDSSARRGLMLVLPRAAVTVLDDWQSSGLQATGSCSFVVADAFVPDALTWPFPHARPRRGGPMYHLGWPGFVVHEPAAFALGVAEHALDTLIASARAREASARSHAIGRETVQRGVGLARVRLRSARALVREVFAEAWDAVSAGRAPAPRLQSEMRAAAALATDVSVDAATFAFRHGGSGSVYRSNALQRCVRDLHAASQHWLVRDSAYTVYGQFLLGVANADPTADAR